MSRPLSVPRVELSRSTRAMTFFRILATSCTLTSLSNNALHTSFSNCLRTSSSIVRFLLSSRNADVSLLPSSVRTMVTASVVIGKD